VPLADGFARCFLVYIWINGKPIRLRGLAGRGARRAGGQVGGLRLYELADRLGFRLAAQHMSKELLAR
jgi:hypothetical protein